MYLKSLEIKGFKSFAEAATLDLEPGVTVVVGPNGSGKSNVVDAIGWVLGAQAPRAVRSQKMDDVIFAGTAKRPALGRAEVSLTIDNASRTLPIEFSEVRISRTLFRSGDSEYAINGVACRLLDIQELLSDSGVGRQQHVIISQGQIDAVLNAKPEDRRLIIEEAAGVLKFRRRKEKSERRLESTEANLLRVQDMLREVRRQLRPLERQADAARRHGQVREELRSLELHLLGRQINRLASQLSDSSSERNELRAAERETKTVLSGLDTKIIEIESRLSTLGGNEIGDVLVRYESLRERAHGLTSLLAERRRGIERARDAFFDEAVVASLEGEHAQLVEQRSDVRAALGRCADSLAEVDARAGELAEAEQAFQEEWSTDPDASSLDAAEIRAQIEAVDSSLHQASADIERTSAQSIHLAERVDKLHLERTELENARVGAEADSQGLAASAADAERALAALEDALVVAETRSRRAVGEKASWQGRADALELALDEARAQAGVDHLGDIDGVLGTLLDLVDIDAGWEHAFEAAIGDAVDAVVVESSAAGRRAIAALADGDLRGAVLALGQDGPGDAVSKSVISQSVGETLVAHCTGTHPGVEGLLRSLLISAVVVDGGWSVALDAALAHPELTVVTRRGDRFGRGGWRVGQAGSGATGAALEEARERAERADEAVGSAELALSEARTALENGRRQATVAVAERQKNRAAVDTCTERLSLLTPRIEEASQESRSAASHLTGVIARADAEKRRRVELASALEPLEAAAAERDEWQVRHNRARTELDSQISVLSAQRKNVDVDLAGAQERERLLEERIERVTERLDRNKAATAEAQRRRLHFDARLEATDRVAAFVAQRLEAIDSTTEGLREARREQSERTRAVTGELEQLRRERAEAEKLLEVTRHKLQRNEIAEAETKMHIEAAVARARDELDVEPDVAVASECPALPEGVSPKARVKELDRDLRQMGPINPLALEEFAALNERHEFLVSQLDDIRNTRKELSKVIRAVDEEIVRVFSAAFADVSQNFTALFEMLFPGGQGGLTLTEPSNLLDTGIEIEARPSGKNVRKLSLLSGGERSLTALAYLFAVFRSRPSPFYVMDEVEAALDDVNLHRFLSLVAEFRSTAQLVIVSHQKRTMEAADVLYGVSMEQGGSSKVISEKIRSGAN